MAKERVSSIGRIFNRLGAEGIDEVLIAICDSCALRVECDKSIAKCEGLNVIVGMAADMSNGPLASIDAPEYLEKLKKAVAMNKKMRERG